MKTMNKTGLMILALLLTLSLGITALAEGTTENTPEVAATETAGDEAQAKADALNEALTAYSNAKAESRKQAYLDSLKQELDAFVTAGKLTQGQADLIYEYYVEQMTLQQNYGREFGRGGKGGRNNQGVNQNGFGKSGQSRQNNQGTNQNGFGKGGRHGRFDNTAASPESVTPSAGTEPAGT